MRGSTLSGAPRAPTEAPPSVIGEKYSVSRLLGAGGMGAVYEAENTWTRRRVAVKVMRPEFTGDPQSVQRFLREAQTAARIEHPNVVGVLDMGRDAATGSLYIVQEFLVGRDLRAALDERRAFAVEPALELLLPVLDGLAAAHALGVVHRDIKPENIFLVEPRAGRVTPKIIDFGIAKALRPAENEFRTMISQAMGTPGYMSPEQARGDLDLDARTDVWAIGVVLYEMLTGRMPYDDDDNPQVMLARVITQEPASLDVVAPSLPAELRAAIHKALQRDRARRYPDMQSFQDALSSTASGARARVSIRRAAELTPLPTTSSVDASPSSPPASPRMHRTAAIGVVLGALLALAGIAAVTAARRSDAPRVQAAPSVAVTRPVPAVPTSITAPSVTAPSVTAPSVTAPSVAAPPAAVVAVPSPTTGEPVAHHGASRPRRREHGDHGHAQRGTNGAAILE